MSQIKAAPVHTLWEMISGLRYSWHSTDYYISADHVINPPPSSAPFRPDFYALILCVQGWMDLTVDNQPVHIGLYHFFAGGPNMVFERTRQSPDCKTNAIYFTKSFLLKHHVNEAQLEAFDFFAGKIHSAISLTQKDAEPLIKLYDILKVKRSTHHEDYHQEIIRNIFFAYLYEAALIYRNKGNTIVKKYSREVDISYKFQQLLIEYGTSHHHLKFYAEALFISEKYMIHAIKRSTGKTPGQLIDEKIIAEAKAQLNDRKRTLATISDTLHFSDQASFSRFFKKHTGQTPSGFRRLL
ncbi:MAG TPA: helix-turn-helix domain-containing protein [Puia sp.]|nr:helix-turn-helix domain-containing protein [Puia sp.]